MSQTHNDLPVALWNLVLVLANQDAELRAQLRNLSMAVLTATEVPEQAADEQPNHQVCEVEIATAPEQEMAQSQDLPALTLGQPMQCSTDQHPPCYSVPIEKMETDFDLIESHCRLKAEGSRWAATRRRMLAEGADFYTEVDPADRDIIERARCNDCYLWMCNSSGPSPTNLNLYDELAKCYETLADAVILIKQMVDEPEAECEFAGALDLLAEAQSAVRIAVLNVGWKCDSTQDDVFGWLRRVANERQILIQRFMRLDDPADPSQASELSERIETMDNTLRETRRRYRQQKKLLGKVRHKSSLIANDPENADEPWRILAATVDELVSDGLPPSNVELREALLPIIDDIPDFLEEPRGFQLVLREIDRFMGSSSPAEGPAVTPPSHQVVEVAKLVEGRAIVLIGGHRRPGAARALKEALGLSELLWIETQEHESIERFETFVARPDVAVVLLAIRWSSHSFGEVGNLCEKHGKPFVRLPGGYNPNQVAAQIMDQCSDRLQ